MRTSTRGILALGLVAAAALASAQNAMPGERRALGVADMAPAIVTAKWVKGQPVEKFEKGKVYVVEFWATWCGPCRESIPHLTELQKKFGDKVTFMGVSAFEDDQAKVAPFVKEMGDKMDYRVAMDKVPDDDQRGQHGAMAMSWMEAAGQNGIPTAFIVDRESKIAWIGHPMQMEQPLSQVVAGTWNRDQFAEQKNKQIQQQSAQDAVIRSLSNALRAKDYVTALKADEDFAAFQPQQAALIRFRILDSKADPTEYKYANGLVTCDFKDDANMLNEMAWMVADPKSTLKKKDFGFAVKAAKRACEITKNNNNALLDTLAWAYYQSGQKSKAVEMEKKAVSLSNDQDRPSFEASLKQMQGK